MSVMSTNSTPISVSRFAVSPRNLIASGALKILLLVGAYPNFTTVLAILITSLL